MSHIDFIEVGDSVKIKNSDKWLRVGEIRGNQLLLVLPSGIGLWRDMEDIVSYRKNIK